MARAGGRKATAAPVVHRTRQRDCGSCKTVDDHPRHVIYARGGPSPIPKHLDCCALDGCARCTADLEGVEGRTGAELRAFLLARREQGRV